MYGLPKNIDFSFLVGSELLQICIGNNEFILNFEKNISITVMTRCSYKALSNKIIEIENSKEAVVLLDLVGRRIDKVYANMENGTLYLYIGEAELAIYDEEGGEAYWIKSPKLEIIV